MFQHIKISKAVIKNLDVKERMLYALIAAHLAIPDFQSPHGGFKPILKRRMANGSGVFDSAWRGLQQKGYLKMLRFPLGENKFEYRFELRSQPDIKTPSIQNMTAARSRRYLQKAMPLYQEPTDQYLIISREVLSDPSLTLNAKWLWTVIYDQLDLFEKGCLCNKDGSPLPYVCKRTLRHASGLCSSVFEKAWALLKRTGYLHATRFFDRFYGVTRCEYTLTPESLLQAEPATQIDQRQRQNRNAKLPPVQPRGIVDTGKMSPDIKLDYAAVEAVIKENIQYDALIRFVRVRQPDGFSYSKTKVDSIVARMVSAICSSQDTLPVNGVEIPIEVVRERLLSLDCTNVLNALHGLWAASETDIHNYRSYLLTVLFNSVEVS